MGTMYLEYFHIIVMNQSMHWFYSNNPRVNVLEDNPSSMGNNNVLFGVNMLIMACKVMTVWVIFP